MNLIADAIENELNVFQNNKTTTYKKRVGMNIV